MYGSSAPGQPTGPVGGPSYYQPQPYAVKPPADGLAIASLVLGICWVCWIGSALAVIFGHISIRNAKAEGRKPSGMAVAGMVLGYIGAGTALFVIFLAVLGSVGSGS